MSRNIIKTFALKVAPFYIVAITASYVVPAWAIVNGQPDNNLHPNTGELVVPGVVYCSGVLLSPTVFATAAHCVQDGFNANVPVTQWTVTFDSQIGPDVNNPTGQMPAASASYDPKWDLNPTDSNGKSFGVPHVANDFAEVTLANPVTGIAPAHLPVIGSLDNLPSGSKNPALESVGYGAYAVDAKKNSLVHNYREYANTYISTDNYSVSYRLLKLATKQGGVCYGDSGGPTFIGADDTTVISLNSGINSINCNAWGYASRLDTQDAHDFYAQYL